MLHSYVFQSENKVYGLEALLVRRTPGSTENEVRIKIVLSKEQIWLRPKSEINLKKNSTRINLPFREPPDHF